MLFEDWLYSLCCSLILWICSLAIHIFHAVPQVIECSVTNDFMDDTPNYTFEFNSRSNSNTYTDVVADEPDNVANFMNYACLEMLNFRSNRGYAMTEIIL